LTAYFAILLGTHQSIKTKKWFGLDYRAIDQLHRHLSIATLVLVLVHAFATLKDAMGDSWKSVFLFDGWANPKTGWPAAVWGYNLGVFGFYAILILGPTFYLRRKLGVQFWKFVHRFIILFYVASLWHTFILGVEFGYYKWLRPVVWLLQLPVLYYLANRFNDLADKNHHQKSSLKFAIPKILQIAFLLSSIAIVILVLTGHSTFIKNNYTGL
jgi:predicted ferric reductase